MYYDSFLTFPTLVSHEKQTFYPKALFNPQKHCNFTLKAITMGEIILEIKNLRKNYADVLALSSLSLTVEKGQIFGLLGPNGSGKTTTLAILLGALNATSGSFSWFGNGMKDENRKNIGSLLETPNFYPYLNAVDNLIVVARIKGMTDYMGRIEEVLKRVNLWERKTSRFRTFSLGMKQRLAIASALLNNPDVLVLDEPTNGLDPLGITEMRNLILEIAQEGKTIIIASHILDEIEKVCTHVAILRKGKLLEAGPLNQIMSQEQLFLVKTADLAALKAVIEDLLDVKFLREMDGELLISSGLSEASSVNRLFAEKGIYLSGLREYRKNLETIFLEIVEA
jgi:ABC-type multidrug transport system ATPase subunit